MTALEKAIAKHPNYARDVLGLDLGVITSQLQAALTKHVRN